MDFRALMEALLAVGFTPIISIIMVLLVLAGLAFFFRRTYRR